MVPISDNIFLFTHRKPVVTYWLIGINLVIFFWELRLEIGNTLDHFVESWGVVPAEITVAGTNLIMGNPAAGIAVLLKSTSLLTGMFLHGSFSQILANLIFLWVFGRTVENILGHKVFGAFYLISGIIVALIQILAQPTLIIPLIGANGAIASILGAYVFKFPKVKIDTVLPLLVFYIPVQLPAFFYIFWWFFQQLFYGIGSLNISNGFNPSSIGYCSQGVGLLIGAIFMGVLQRR